MTLNQFLSTLTSTTLQVTIKDVVSGNEIAVIKAGSYASLEDTIESREIAQWYISSMNNIVVLLKQAEEVQNENEVEQ